MPRRRKIIEILAPTQGIRSDTPSTIMEPRAQPNGQDSKPAYGMLQKEYGTSLYATGTSSVLNEQINMLLQIKYPSANILEVLTPSAVYKYNAGVDSFTSDGQAFTGTVSDYWAGVVHNEQFIYSNGVNNTQIKTSFSATGTDMNSAVTPTTYKAWSLQSYREHLNMYHTIEDGSEFTKRVRWTKKGLLSPSGTDDFTAGTAGFVDVQDCEGEIRTSAPLGAGIAVYAERSIHIQFFVGGGEVYRFEKMVSNLGTPSRRGVVSWKDINYFISEENFHAYHGGDDIRDIGDPIKALAFGAINNSALTSAFVEVDPYEEEVLYHVPTGTSTAPDTVWVYRVNDKAWSKLSRAYTAPGIFSRRTGLTIGELVGNIGAQNYKFGDVTVNAEAQTRLYGDASGRVSKVDKTRYSLSNAGTTAAQHFIYETPDLTAHNLVDIDKDKVDFTNTVKRWTQLNVDMQGNGTAIVSYSTNGGRTYESMPQSPVTLVSTGTTHELDIDIDSKYIRYRIENTGTNEFIGITYVGVELIPQGEK